MLFLNFVLKERLIGRLQIKLYKTFSLSITMPNFVIMFGFYGKFSQQDIKLENIGSNSTGIMKVFNF